MFILWGVAWALAPLYACCRHEPYALDRTPTQHDPAGASTRSLDSPALRTQRWLTVPVPRGFALAGTHVVASPPARRPCTHVHD